MTCNDQRVRSAGQGGNCFDLKSCRGKYFLEFHACVGIAGRGLAQHVQVKPRGKRRPYPVFIGNEIQYPDLLPGSRPGKVGTDEIGQQAGRGQIPGLSPFFIKVLQ